MKLALNFCPFVTLGELSNMLWSAVRRRVWEVLCHIHWLLRPPNLLVAAKVHVVIDLSGMNLCSVGCWVNAHYEPPL